MASPDEDMVPPPNQPEWYSNFLKDQRQELGHITRKKLLKSVIPSYTSPVKPKRAPSGPRVKKPSHPDTSGCSLSKPYPVSSSGGSPKRQNRMAIRTPRERKVCSGTPKASSMNMARRAPSMNNRTALGLTYPNSVPLLLSRTSTASSDVENTFPASSPTSQLSRGLSSKDPIMVDESSTLQKLPLTPPSSSPPPLCKDKKGYTASKCTSSQRAQEPVISAPPPSAQLTPPSVREKIPIQGFQASIKPQKRASTPMQPTGLKKAASAAVEQSPDKDVDLRTWDSHNPRLFQSMRYLLHLHHIIQKRSGNPDIRGCVIGTVRHPDPWHSDAFDHRIEPRYVVTAGIDNGKLDCRVRNVDIEGGTIQGPDNSPIEFQDVARRGVLLNGFAVMSLEGAKKFFHFLDSHGTVMVKKGLD